MKKVSKFKAVKKQKELIQLSLAVMLTLVSGVSRADLQSQQATPDQTAPRITALTNSASFEKAGDAGAAGYGHVAFGSLATLFGVNFPASQSVPGPTDPLPYTLGGLSVEIYGVNFVLGCEENFCNDETKAPLKAQLLFASKDQINLILPWHPQVGVWRYSLLKEGKAIASKVFSTGLIAPGGFGFSRIDAMTSNEFEALKAGRNIQGKPILSTTKEGEPQKLSVQRWVWLGSVLGFGPDHSTYSKPLNLEGANPIFFKGTSTYFVVFTTGLKGFLDSVCANLPGTPDRDEICQKGIRDRMKVVIGDQEQEITYVGSPQFFGQEQINIKVSPFTPKGWQPMSIRLKDATWTPQEELQYVEIDNSFH